LLLLLPHLSLSYCLGIGSPLHGGVDAAVVAAAVVVTHGVAIVVAADAPPPPHLLMLRTLPLSLMLLLMVLRPMIFFGAGEGARAVFECVAFCSRTLFKLLLSHFVGMRSAASAALSTAASGRGISVPTPGRRLKRRKTDGAPPSVRDRVCVGDHAVPYEIIDVDDKASMVVDVSLRRKCPAWLVQALGWAVMPSRCIIQELSDAVTTSRVKRTPWLWKGGGPSS
jgi:hypothetical protein